MKPNEKALDLVSKFKEYVHGYVGSSMLTNYEYPEQVLSQAKDCALIVADECYNEAYKQATEISLIRQDYWKEVKVEIEKL